MMEAEAARNVLNWMAGGGLVVWVASAWFVSWAGRMPRNEADGPYDPEAGRRRTLSGELEIEGLPGELVDRSARLLASGKLGLPFGPARILERTSDRLEFKMSAFSPRERGSFSASLTFTPRGSSRSLVRYEAPLGWSGMLLAARIVLAVGLAGLIALYLGLGEYVVGSSNPSVRGQAFQMMQIIHLLWPPFLLAGLERARRRTIRNSLETFVANLPHVG